MSWGSISLMPCCCHGSRMISETLMHVIIPDTCYWPHWGTGGSMCLVLIPMWCHVWTDLRLVVSTQVWSAIAAVVGVWGIPWQPYSIVRDLKILRKGQCMFFTLFCNVGCQWFAPKWVFSPICNDVCLLSRTVVAYLLLVAYKVAWFVVAASLFDSREGCPCLAVGDMAKCRSF